MFTCIAQSRQSWKPDALYMLDFRPLEYGKKLNPVCHNKFGRD